MILGKNGLIKVAVETVKTSNEEEAKEKLELALADLRAHKYSNKNYNQNEYVDNYLKSKEITINSNIAVVNGITFEIDRENLIVVRRKQAYVTITSEIKERLEDGFANLLIEIESDTPIESIEFPNENGTSLELKTEKLTLAKDLKVELDKEYIVKVITKDGKITSEIIKVERVIADVVSVGDFVNYSVGNWTQKDIEKLGTYYFGEALPNTKEKFGGFKLGQSKDNSIKPTTTNENNIYSGGWRVLNKNLDGTINIVHAGTPEAYNVPRSVHNDSSLKASINIIGKYRDWTMYEDCSTDAINTNYAVQGSAHGITTSEILSIKKDNPLRAIGVQYNYYYKVAAGSPYYFLRSIRADGTDGSSSLGSIGIRPVVTIKSEVKAIANEGQTMHDTQETAWNLSLNE